MFEYWLGLVATVAFALTGVLAVRHRDVDVFGIVVFGTVTAVGGGTVRDLILNAPVFWSADSTYLWIAMGASVAGFALRAIPRRAERLLLYLDAVGVALFAIHSTRRSLEFGFSVPGSVIIGLITGIGGGLLRDVLSGRTNLLLTRELYATPIVIGCSLYAFCMRVLPELAHRELLAVVVLFALRAAAIRFEWTMPTILVRKADG